MKILKSYKLFTESFDLSNAYDYEVLGTTEKVDKSGDKYLSFLYSFVDNNGRKYYVGLTSWEMSYYSFSADFRTEEEYLKDEKSKTDILDIKYLDTNRFDAFRVLSTVFLIIKNFYEYNIKTLTSFAFVADDIKRRNIYKNIIQKLFPDWKLVRDEELDGTWHLEYNFGSALNEAFSRTTVRDQMLPKSVDDIDEIISNWTYRERYLKGIKMDVDYLKSDALKHMKKFEDVEIGDYLTIAVPKDGTDQPLTKIKEKYTFNSKEEFKNYLKEHPGIIVDSNALKILFKSYPNQKRDAVVVNLVYDMMFEYGRNCGVFPYTEEDFKDISTKPDLSSEMKSRFHDEYLAEGIRDSMTPKEGSIDKINKVIKRLANMLLKDKYFDNYDDAIEFLSDEGIYDNVIQMKSLGMTYPEVYIEVTQFNLDEYLYNKGLPLKFAVNPEWKDDVETVGSDAYNKEHKMFYYETKQSKAEKDSQRRKIMRTFNEDDYPHMNESVRDKMTPKSNEDIEDAFEDIACRIADILLEKEEFDDYLDAYEWAYNHKEYLMRVIDEEPEYDLEKIIRNILYGAD
jgi:hypothetical protein